jgi:hypothetical protein
MKICLFALTFFALSACKLDLPILDTKPANPAMSERVVPISNLIDAKNPLLTKIKSSRCIEEQVGDGYLGPSDFSIFCVMSVDPKDIDTFRHTFSKPKNLNGLASYISPRKTVDWWISKPDFEHLEFFEPGLLSTQRNGWTAISSKNSKVYAFSFTR